MQEKNSALYKTMKFLELNYTLLSELVLFFNLKMSKFGLNVLVSVSDQIIEIDKLKFVVLFFSANSLREKNKVIE